MVKERLEKWERGHGSQRKETDPTYVDIGVEVSELFSVVGTPKLSHMGK